MPMDFEPTPSLSIDYEELKFYKEGLSKAENGEVKYRKSR